MENVLITGISGGIGKGVAEKLLDSGSSVIGLDRVIGVDIEEIKRKAKKKDMFMKKWQPLLEQ